MASLYRVTLSIYLPEPEARLVKSTIRDLLIELPPTIQAEANAELDLAGPYEM